MPHFAEKDTLKRGELDDQANPTFPQKHMVENTIRVPPRAGESKNYLPRVSQILLKLVNK
jgi:hypothetical protein